MQVTVHNRGPDDAEIHVLPSLWFRHTWSWGGSSPRPELRSIGQVGSASVVRAEHQDLGTRWFSAAGEVPALVTGNETNNERTFGIPNDEPYVKDGIDRAVVHGETTAVNPDGVGTKAAFHHTLVVPAGGSRVVRARLSTADPAVGIQAGDEAFGDFDQVMTERRREADEFYEELSGRRPGRGRAAGGAPGARRDAVVQAVLRL